MFAVRTAFCPLYLDLATQFRVTKVWQLSAFFFFFFFLVSFWKPMLCEIGPTPTNLQVTESQWESSASKMTLFGSWWHWVKDADTKRCTKTMLYLDKFLQLWVFSWLRFYHGPLLVFIWNFRTISFIFTNRSFQQSNRKWKLGKNEHDDSPSK